jgi:Flp pilus assembly protein TadG
MNTFFTRLRNDKRGSTAIEFAFIAPSFFLLLMGTFDLGYREFIYATLQGEVQKAARDGTLEGGAAAITALNVRIEDRVRPIVSNAYPFVFERKKYSSFTRAGQAENFTDGNANGTRETGECFQDENANGIWDAVGGVNNSQGGSDDIVQLKVTVTYPRLIPMYGMAGWSRDQTLSATQVLRNQPFGTQVITPPVAVCT